MNNKLFKKNLIIYELRNLFGSPYNLGFGFIFPIFMGCFIITTVINKIPAGAIDMYTVQYFIGYLMFSPLAFTLIGFPTLFSDELQNNGILRLNLFGYSNRDILFAKLIANLTATILGSILYVFIVGNVINITIPSYSVILLFILFILLITIMLFFIGYCVSMIFKKTSTTFAITMPIYFIIMIISGLMGIARDELPKLVIPLSNNIPFSYLVNDAYALWSNPDSYNFAPLFQSFIVSGSIIILLLMYVLYKNRRLN